jgi:hypothetical protein
LVLLLNCWTVGVLAVNIGDSVCNTVQCFQGL